MHMNGQTSQLPRPNSPSSNLNSTQNRTHASTASYTAPRQKQNGTPSSTISARNMEGLVDRKSIQSSKELPETVDAHQHSWISSRNKLVRRRWTTSSRSSSSRRCPRISANMSVLKLKASQLHRPPRSVTNTSTNEGNR